MDEYVGDIRQRVLERMDAAGDGMKKLKNLIGERHQEQSRRNPFPFGNV